ncbi:DNA mismatch repair protein MutS, partial [bacterium]|nr:DNA mismatch repair protein MutS [candidate division CSSED10-310 bacterium]
ETRQELRAVLGSVYDLERLNSRICLGIANARDLVAVRSSLEAAPAVLERLHDLACKPADELAEGIDPLVEIRELLDRAIESDPPLTLRDGGLVRGGYDAELDELRDLSRSGKKHILGIQENERRRTGISTLKVRYNKVFGYFIEVSKTHLEKVPDDYIRKQTLVNAERFITQELKEYEEKVLGAEEKIIDLEYKIFQDVRGLVAAQSERMLDLARGIGAADALGSLAEVAREYGYNRPVVDETDRIDITGGRHPVVERIHIEAGFTPNDVFLDNGGSQILIITGPNMAGKSTFIRQVALIVLMAQMGGFVPADRAEIGVVDRIFTRVGASDNLYGGLSTFMVEMTETSNILHNATPRSLVILDEVGRGTSTFDGMSLAWAIVEYLHERREVAAKTLFATHYHELTELASTLGRVRNFNVAVKEWNDQIVFLRKIVPGGADRSYGIQVARLAGLPVAVVDRAKEILVNLEQYEFDVNGRPTRARTRSRKPAPVEEKNPRQLNLFAYAENAVIKELEDLDVEAMTPLQALNYLSALKGRIKR